jgi:hypothetical protein
MTNPVPGIHPRTRREPRRRFPRCVPRQSGRDTAALSGRSGWHIGERQPTRRVMSPWRAATPAAAD